MKNESRGKLEDSSVTLIFFVFSSVPLLLCPLSICSYVIMSTLRYYVSYTG